MMVGVFLRWIIRLRCKELFGPLYNPLGICNPSPGMVDKNGRRLAGLEEKFCALSRRSHGVAELYQAQPLFYRGNLAEAEALGEKVWATAQYAALAMTALGAFGLRS